MTIDLDALEKLADEAAGALRRLSEYTEKPIPMEPSPFVILLPEDARAILDVISPATIKALIAELKEARGCWTIWSVKCSTRSHRMAKHRIARQRNLLIWSIWLATLTEPSSPAMGRGRDESAA